MNLPKGCSLLFVNDQHEILLLLRDDRPDIPSVDLRLRLVPPLAEVARAQKAVAKLASKHRPASVTLRLAGKAVPRSAGSPQGGEGSSTGRPQLIK